MVRFLHKDKGIQCGHGLDPIPETRGKARTISQTRPFRSGGQLFGVRAIRVGSSIFVASGGWESDGVVAYTLMNR